MDGQVTDLQKRRFLLWLTGLMAGVGALFAAFPFFASWRPSAKARAAAAPVEIDISGLRPGEMMTIEWRGKPVWIIRRSEAHVAQLEKTPAFLRDPQSKVPQQPEYAQNFHRSVRPEYLILVGLCTHLGCSPNFVPGIGAVDADWPGGFYCPCHGSKFDLAGRVYTGVPAPINLEVPPHHFTAMNTVVIGEDPMRQVS